MLIRITVLGGIFAAAALAVSPAQALTSQECSAKYKAAQDAGTLNGMKWNDFRQANCGTPDAAPTANSTAPDAVADEPKTASTAKASVKNATAPAGVPFPSAVASKYAKETPTTARMHTCLDQYRLNKANNALGGLKWIQKGGGYYSLCNARLKS